MKKSIYILLFAILGICFCSSGCIHSNHSIGPADDVLTHPEAVEITEDNISGIWVDENGFSLKIDTEDGYVVDTYGHKFPIEEINEAGVLINTSCVDETASFANVAPTFAHYMSLPFTYQLNMTLYNDGLNADYLVYGEDSNMFECVRLESEQGQSYMDQIIDSMINVEMTLSLMDSDFILEEDTLTLSGIESPYDYTGGLLIVHSEDDIDSTIAVRRINSCSWGILAIDYDSEEVLPFTEPVFLSVYDSYAPDELVFENEYIYWDVSSLTLGNWVISDDGKVVITDNTGDSLVSDISVEMLPLFEVEELGLQFSMYGDVGYTIDSSFMDNYGILIRRQDLFAQMLIHRDLVVNGEADDNGFTTEYEEEEVITRLSVQPGSNPWLYDYFYFIDMNSIMPTRFIEEDYDVDILGEMLSLDIQDGFDGLITLVYEVPLEMVDNPENLRVTTNEFLLTSTDLVEIDSTIEITDDTIIITSHPTDKGNYLLINYNQAIEEIRDTVFTSSLILDTNPEDSLWALTCDTGDIIPMVDMDYIEDSLFGNPNYGSANFWVSTPEELASAIYYINSHDVNYATTATMYYIHLMDDIDLTGLDWVSIGYYGNQGEVSNAPFIYDAETTLAPCGVDRDMDRAVNGVQHYYQGVFFGNGHTIRGLNIDSSRGSSFFERGHLATVIGLTLEDPQVDYPWVYVDDSACIMEYYDCHIVYTEEPEELPDFGYSGNASISYFDCSFIIDGEEYPLDSSYQSSEHHNSADNWVRMYYQSSNGEYNYNPESEYEAWLENRTLFEDMDYYLGDHYDFMWGYLGVSGWSVNEHFASNFGFWDF